MLSIKTCAVYYIFLNIVVKIHTLVPLTIVEDNNIITTEKTIRNTVNSLFEAFKVHGIRNRPKIKQFSTIHNFFVTITLKDCYNLAEVARLSRFNVIDNSTQSFIAQINEVLNADDKSKEENDSNIHVATYIQKFIQKLKHLKEAYMPNKNTIINAKILQYISIDGHAPVNVTEESIKSNKTSKELEYEKILDEDDVWQPSSRRIYNGIRSSIKKFPFMASIHFFNKFQCAGSIIKDDLVITSASCLQIAWNNRFFRENPAFLSVRIGCDYYDFCGESISVLEIYFHPQYDPKTLKHNIAIMRLNRKINFRRSHGRVKKIEVDKNPWGLPYTCSITVVGWGAKDHSNIVYDVFKNKLSYAKLDMYLLQDCQEHYSKEFVTNRNFCAGFYSKGGGACNRDAGGPGICDNTLMGVISFGSAICGGPESPTVFTKLGFYWEWIENIVEQVTVLSGSMTTTRPPREKVTYVEESTTKEMKMYPIGDTPVSSETSEKIALRLAHEEYFKDFLSTIFESEEINAYLDTSVTERKVNAEKLAKIDNKQKKVIDSSDDDVDIREKNDEISVETVTESLKAVTVLENASDDKMNGEESNNDEIDGGRGNDNYEQINNPKIAEKDIMALIDDLDIDELLKSIQPSETAGINNKTKEYGRTQEKQRSSIKNVTVSNNTGNKIKITSSQKSYQDLNVHENDEDEEDGLSIEAEPFIAASFKDRRNSTETRDVLSNQSSVYNYVTVAIEKQGKKINKKKRYLL